jgi:hypothetical protein
MTALRSAKLAYEFNTKMNLRNAFRQFFGMPKILRPFTKLLPEPEKFSRVSYDCKRYPHEWPDVIAISSEFELFLIPVSLSDAKFGTV